MTPVQKRILSALEKHGDMMVDEIAEAACCSVETLTGGGYMRKLVQMELVRVARWVRSSTGPAAPVYSIKPGKSAERPRPYTDAEKSRRWRRRAGYRSAEWKTRKTMEQLVRITA